MHLDRGLRQSSSVRTRFLLPHVLASQGFLGECAVNLPRGGASWLSERWSRPGKSNITKLQIEDSTTPVARGPPGGDDLMKSCGLGTHKARRASRVSHVGSLYSPSGGPPASGSSGQTLEGLLEGGPHHRQI
jgi:hypothetical protein